MQPTNRPFFTISEKDTCMLLDVLAEHARRTSDQQISIGLKIINPEDFWQFTYIRLHKTLSAQAWLRRGIYLMRVQWRKLIAKVKGVHTELPSLDLVGHALAQIALREPADEFSITVHDELSQETWKFLLYRNTENAMTTKIDMTLYGGWK